MVSKSCHNVREKNQYSYANTSTNATLARRDEKHFLLNKGHKQKNRKTHVIAEARECKVAIGGQILLNKSRRIGKKWKHQVKQKRRMSYQ